MNQKVEIRKFFIRGFIFLCLVLLIDFVVGNVLEYYFFQKKSGEDFRCTNVLNKIEPDVLILGSSRASHHYNSILLSDTLNLSCFNGGRDGHYFLYNAIIALSVLDRYSPKILLFDIEALQMGDSLPRSEFISDLLPYYDRNDIIKLAIDSLYEYTYLASFTKTIRYNSKVLGIIKGQFVSEDLSKDLGFFPLNGSMRSVSKAKVLTEIPKVSHFNVKILKRLIDEAKKVKTSLFFVQSPRYVLYDNKSLSDSIDSYGGNFIITDCNELFLNKPFYFKDQAHLNLIGANAFSRRLVSYIHIDENF